MGVISQMGNIYTKIVSYHNWGGRFLNDPFHLEAKKLNEAEFAKTPLRSDIINYLIKQVGREHIVYLEIGVRNPNDNFNKIVATEKYSVDPGLEFEENPVDFKVTSDEFFAQLREGKVLDRSIRFDVIFIDGLHIAEQVDRDIRNALEFLKEDGFIVMHDCNPPTEYHARENTHYKISPAGNQWNGTTWKAFVQARQRSDIYSCCVDTDWGVGVISKKVNLGGSSLVANPYFEFAVLNSNRKESLNLISFNEFKAKFNQPSGK